MFTGLIEAQGVLRRMETRGSGRRATFSAPFVSELALGDSVACDGVCLTVVALSSDTFSVDISAESIARSTLGALSTGGTIHLERAMQMGGRFGGHIVSGHIDGVGRLTAREKLGEAQKLTFSGPGKLARYVVEKGSIAIDGASLTVNEVHDYRGGDFTFSIVLIPHSQSLLHLGERPVGTQVNLEVDVIGKYVERMVSKTQQSSGLTIEDLARAGF